MNRITFKRGPLGNRLQRVGAPFPNVDIKLNGAKIGYLSPPTWQTKDRKWGIRFSVKHAPTPQNPVEWTWFCVKARFDTEVEARAFVVAHGTHC